MSEGGAIYKLNKEITVNEEIRWNYGNYKDSEEEAVRTMTEWTKPLVSMTFTFTTSQPNIQNGAKI